MNIKRRTFIKNTAVAGSGVIGLTSLPLAAKDDKTKSVNPTVLATWANLNATTAAA